MEPVTVLKVVHVLSAITAVGANLTYAFWLRRAGRDRDRLVWTIKTVRRLDNGVANPAYVILLITGVAMVLLGAFSFETGWIALSLVIYIVVATMGFLAFAPAIRHQLAEAEADPTSAAYAAAARRSNILGLTTTALAVVIVILMVAKPL
jgi:uncharacterized membrane protein